MATITQCRFCNRLFQSISGNICPNCNIQIDEDFMTIRDYIYDNPGRFNIDAICEATGVQKRVVLHLIKEQRLILESPEAGGLSCSVCHKPIASGEMCEECRLYLSSKLGSVPPSPASKPEPAPMESGKKGKMHIRRKTD